MPEEGLLSQIKRFVVGRPIPSHLAHHERIALDQRRITDPGYDRTDGHGCSVLQDRGTGGHAESLLPVTGGHRLPPLSVANCTSRTQVDHGGGGAAGGGGPSTGTVMGGNPGISTTVEPISGGNPGIAPGGGGGGGGGMPLEIWIVMIEPGTV